MSWDFDPSRVDEYETADACRIKQRHLGCNPAPDRVAHDGDAGDVELDQQRCIKGRQTANACEPVRSRGIGKPWVGGSDYAGVPLPSKQVSESADREPPAGALEQQEGQALG